MTAKRKRRIIVLAAFIAAAWLFHAPLLRGLAGLLIVDQPTDDYDCVCISAWGDRRNGDRCYDVAVELYRKKPSCRILLIVPEPNRLEEIEAIASFATISERELLARHVPPGSVSVLRGQRWNDWDTARALAAWLHDHPGKSVLLLCGQFHTAQLRSALDSVLAPDKAASVRVHALRHRECDETNWWTCRAGFRMFGGSWLLRLQTWLTGGDTPPSPEKCADDYERDFLKRFQEDAP
jgi:hypothetical protein